MQAKQNILIVGSTQSQADNFRDTLQHELNTCQFFLSPDGRDALSKIDNSVPEAVVLHADAEASHTGGILKRLLNDKRLQKTPLLFLSDQSPSQEQLEEIAQARLQWLPKNPGSEQLIHAVRCALNFSLAPKSIESGFRVVHMKEGEVLIKQGEQSRTVYILKRGKLKALDQSSGTVVALGEISEGEFVGEMAYIHSTSRSAHVVAAEDSEVVEIPAGHMDYLMYKKPTWSRALVKTLSRRILQANELKMKREE